MLWHFQEKLHNQENLVFGWCQRGFELYETPQTEVTLCCFWKARSECLMSSKRKEKKIKGTDTVPLPPPHRNSQFFLHPSEIFQRSKVHVTVNPLRNDFQSLPPPPPSENLVHSGGDWEWIFEWNRPQFIYGLIGGLLDSSSKLKENNNKKIVGG